MATVRGRGGQRGGGGIYVFGGAGPAAPSGLGDLFRCADAAAAAHPLTAMRLCEGYRDIVAAMYGTRRVWLRHGSRWE